MPDAHNTLYYGDNLDILRRYVDDESVDLIYLDPPFNSNADYNVLFAEKDGSQAHAQITAFEDTWQWGLEAEQEYAEILRSGHDRVAKAVKGMRDFIGASDMLAYLVMAVSKAVMEEYDREGRLYFPQKEGGRLRLKRYLDEQAGKHMQNLWLDIPPINSRAQERLGYPTQKPEALLERVIAASSNEGDVVLDPFCGCGTAVVAAQRLNRRWLGIDITHLAINLIKVRLADAFGTKITETYKVVGEPEDLEGAKALAELDKYQFQYWALGLVGARPAPGQEKKGADKGIDGRLYMTDAQGETKSIIISVKGGHATVSQVRDLRGVIERDDAAIGVFVTLEPPTAPMKKEAAEAGFWQTKSLAGTKHPRLQILTIEDLLNGKRIDMPTQQDVRSFKQAPKAKTKRRKEAELF